MKNWDQIPQTKIVSLFEKLLLRLTWKERVYVIKNDLERVYVIKNDLRIKNWTSKKKFFSAFLKLITQIFLFQFKRLNFFPKFSK